MKNVLREGFDFNDAISDINNIANNILNNIYKENITNIVNKLLPDYIFSIINTDAGMNIIFQYDEDNDENDVVIKLIYSNNIVNVYLQFYGDTYVGEISKCIIQILKYLKKVGVNISEVINFDNISCNKSTNSFYLYEEETSQVLIFIENNYKIKLVNLTNGLNIDKIDKLTIMIYPSEIEKEDMLKDNIINIDKNTQISLHLS